METIETYVCQESDFPGELIFNTLATIREHGQSEALTSFLSNDPYFAENFIKEVEDGKVEIDTEGLGRSLKKGLSAIKDFFSHSGTYDAELKRGWKRLDETLAYLRKEGETSKMVRVVPFEDIATFTKNSLAFCDTLAGFIENPGQFKNDVGKVVTALDKAAKASFKGDKKAEYNNGITITYPKRESVDILAGEYAKGSAGLIAIDKSMDPSFKRMGKAVDVLFKMDFDNMPKEEYNVLNKLFLSSETTRRFLKNCWDLQIETCASIHKDVK
jgi:hypothetical protein